jgi:hypothetical protein
MDSLKPIITNVKKYHFWVLAAVVLAVSLTTWWWATAEMTRQTESRKRKLDGHFGEMSRIVSVPNHPNQATINAIKATTEELKKVVHQAWKKMYDIQHEANQLPDVLSEGFKRRFRGLTPGKELEAGDLEFYQNNIRHYLPELWKLADIALPKQSQPDGRGNPDQPVEMTGIVEWNEANRKQLEDRLSWQQRPTTAEVRLAQEDLWVYEALLKVIKATNGDASTREDAAIRAILGLHIAAEAGGERPKSTSRDDGPVFPTLGHAGPAARPRDQKDLLARRYVDDQDRPIDAGEPPPYAEFNMMPIRMELLIHQKSIPRLLVECANSQMPIEVRRLRIRPVAGQTRERGGHSGGIPQAHGTSPPARHRTTGATVATDVASTTHVPLELYGVIYIFNPPDETKLGTGAAAKEGSASETSQSPHQPTPLASQ